MAEGHILVKFDVSANVWEVYTFVGGVKTFIMYFENKYNAIDEAEKQKKYLGVPIYFD